MYDYWRVRRYLGLTQQAVSLATGITVNRIAASERGQLALSRIERERIKNYLTDKMNQLAVLEGFAIPANEASIEVSANVSL